MKIGILGGGQLARMMIEAGSRFGYDFIIYSTEKNSPAGRMCSREYFGNWDNLDAIDEFTRSADVITLENEFIDYKIIEHIENNGGVVKPDSSVVKMVQDKLLQKNFLKEISVPVADFTEINSHEDISRFCGKVGFPVVLKSRTMGYDGKGNYMIKSESDIDVAYSQLSERGKLMCEEFINFNFEAAIQAVRNEKGEIKFYPIVETLQEDHICHLVKAPLQLPADMSDYLLGITEKVLNKLNYIGVMGIEFFVTKSKILINELAPRVHNTGHYTIEACDVSQFENHIRAVTGLPLGNTEMKCKSAVMINILGTRDGDCTNPELNSVMKMRNIYLHLYGKEKISKGRKMGHITAIADDIGIAEVFAVQARKLIDI